ncbi:hypothetical protein SAMN06295924_105168 [Rathayibacter rathayi NCPPB 2980 = VKM Ac-1601]|nr:hypothetical protein FB469_0162 [Rathayibacter rathayi]SOE04810.1 hypothetical protein SAMN06295924_105168 [Rathayibacter rathayi NCPPB 2980 = VKM Ac-1601]
MFITQDGSDSTGGNRRIAGPVPPSFLSNEHPVASRARRYPDRVPVSPPSLPRARARAAAAYPNRLLLTKRASGTNGWLSSWGTNAHGEIAGCPPPPA